jgi:hypothetical protein
MLETLSAIERGQAIPGRNWGRRDNGGSVAEVFSAIESAIFPIVASTFASIVSWISKTATAGRTLLVV